MLKQVLSHYQILERLGEVGWALSTRPVIGSERKLAEIYNPRYFCLGRLGPLTMGGSLFPTEVLLRNPQVCFCCRARLAKNAG
jgi:hypothetical protein